jgi:hypothetical protein
VASSGKKLPAIVIDFNCPVESINYVTHGDMKARYDILMAVSKLWSSGI